MSKIIPKLISKKRFGPGMYACASAFSADREMLVGVIGRYSLYSSDLGETWQITDAADVKPIDVNFLRLSDGTYIGFGFDSAVQRQFPKDQEKIPYVLKIMRADTIEQLRSGQPTVSFAALDIPSLSIGYGDSGTEDDYHTGCVDHGIVELENGDIVVSMYGQFKEDITYVPYFENYHFCQYRTWCIISHDRGKTFEYLSTIADVQTHPINREAEGYCESEFLYLGGGHILAALRTQGHEVYSPMYACHSYDGGRTWSSPVKMNDYGVYPKLVRLTDGTIVCAAGKYHNFLLFSTDDGLTWSEPYIMAENTSGWDKGTSGYPSLFEVEPNVIVVVYDDTEDRVSDFSEHPLDRRILFAEKYRITRED